MFTLIVIPTLQNDRLNRGYYLLLYVLPYLCTFAPSKITLQSFSLLGTYASTLYIGKTPKTALFAIYRLFSLDSTYFAVSVSLQPSFSVFVFTRFFVSQNLCVKHYASYVYSCKVKMYVHAGYYDK